MLLGYLQDGAKLAAANLDGGSEAPAGGLQPAQAWAGAAPAQGQYSPPLAAEFYAGVGWQQGMGGGGWQPNAAPEAGAAYPGQLPPLPGSVAYLSGAPPPQYYVAAPAGTYGAQPVYGWGPPPMMMQQGGQGAYYTYGGRPSKLTAHHGVEARARPRPVKYAGDGRPVFTL